MALGIYLIPFKQRKLDLFRRYFIGSVVFKQNAETNSWSSGVMESVLLASIVVCDGPHWWARGWLWTCRKPWTAQNLPVTIPSCLICDVFDWPPSSTLMHVVQPSLNWPQGQFRVSFVGRCHVLSATMIERIDILIQHSLEQSNSNEKSASCGASDGSVVFFQVHKRYQNPEDKPGFTKKKNLQHSQP